MCRKYSLVIVLFLYYGAASDELLNKFELLDNVDDVDDTDFSAKCIALLVENSPVNFENALNFLKGGANMNGDSITDFWLITFNSSGTDLIGL